ncbi:MAG: hypothetical protein RLZZ288_1628, partial [Planctomycetota bacterium]
MNRKLVSSRSLAASFLLLACSGVARGQGATVYGVAAWGVNAYGQTDVPATASARISDIAITLINGYALKDGAVIGWGSKDLDPDPYGGLDIPADAQSGVAAISGGGYHVLALNAQGRVIAWGFNVVGQCDVPSAALTGVSSIAGGGFHSL